MEKISSKPTATPRADSSTQCPVQEHQPLVNRRHEEHGWKLYDDTLKKDGGRLGPESEWESHQLLPPCVDNHYPFLDLTRIICVWCVCVDHGNSSFGHFNIMFTQDWVLQYLYLVCGVCYGMSERDLLSYETRLLAYFVLGVFVNMVAWTFTGQDWWNNMFDVIFHLWFVAGLMLNCAILAPLKTYLKKCRQQAAAAAISKAMFSDLQEPSYRSCLLQVLVVIGGGIVGIMIIFTVVLDPVRELIAPFVGAIGARGRGASFWGIPHDTKGARTFLNHTCNYLMLTCTNIYLLIVGPRIQCDMTFSTWLLIMNTYGHRCLFYRAADERPFHGLDIMMISLACYYLGLFGRRTIGNYIVRYWFCVLLLFSLLWEPGTMTRYDESPPAELTVRIRVNLLEGLFVTVWLVAGERLVQSEIFTEDKLQFMNYWALIVFLVHKAVHIAIVPPFNWVVLLAIVPACHYYCTSWDPPKPKFSKSIGMQTPRSMA